MKHSYFFFCLTIALCTVGCVGPSRIMQAPSTLDEVNSALEGQTATIILLDGRRIGNLRMLRVEPDSTFYRSYQSPRITEQVATAKITQIRFRTDSGARDGFLVGVLPGLVLGVAGLVASQDNGGGVIGYTAVFGGAAIALGGGLLGAILGNSLGKYEMVVYEHPVDAYLNDATKR